jgi:hypothetical protein
MVHQDVVPITVGNLPFRPGRGIVDPGWAVWLTFRAQLKRLL